MLADITNAAKASQNPGEPLSESGVIIALRKGIKDRVSELLEVHSIRTQNICESGAAL